MISVALKYFFIILCSIYIFVKLQNITFSKLQKAIYLFLAIPLTFIVYLTRDNYIHLTLIIIICLLTVIFYLFCKIPITNAFSFTTISVGISYLTYIISSFITAPAAYILFSRLDNSTLNIISFFFIGIFQTVLCLLLFKIKRFKKGIAAYKSKLTSDLGVLISLSLLLLASLFNNEKNPYFIGTIILFCVIIIGLLLLFWWKKHIKNIYLEKVYKRNVEILEKSLAEQQEINQKLKQSNDELSSIIHRDNKLIPAMESAVEEILACSSPDEQKEKSQALLSKLKAMSSERSTILTDYENLHKTLAQTGIFSIDASLKYLMKRANKDNVSFDLSVTCDIKESAKDLICENDLNTLILDLGENALIAVREAKKRTVLVVLGTENESFIISVYDSGITFEKKVIDNLGKRRITTHKKTGGSGIGLMTTAQLLRKHNASFVIDENVDSESYTKKVSVIFDGLSQCRLITATNKITRPL